MLDQALTAIGAIPELTRDIKAIQAELDARRMEDIEQRHRNDRYDNIHATVERVRAEHAAMVTAVEVLKAENRHLKTQVEQQTPTSGQKAATSENPDFAQVSRMFQVIRADLAEISKRLPPAWTESRPEAEDAKANRDWLASQTKDGSG